MVWALDGTPHATPRRWLPPCMTTTTNITRDDDEGKKRWQQQQQQLGLEMRLEPPRYVFETLYSLTNCLLTLRIRARPPPTTTMTITTIRHHHDHFTTRTIQPPQPLAPPEPYGHYFSIRHNKTHVLWSPGIRLLVTHHAQTLECGGSSPILIIRVI